MSGADIYHAPGKIIDVSEEEGKRLIKAGFAEKAEEVGKVHQTIISEKDIVKKRGRPKK